METNEPNQSPRDIWNEPGAAGRALNRSVEPPAGQWDAIEARIKRRRRGFFWLWPLIVLLAGGMGWYGYQRFGADSDTATELLAHREARPSASPSKASTPGNEPLEPDPTPGRPSEQNQQGEDVLPKRARPASERVPAPAVQETKPAEEPAAQPDNRERPARPTYSTLKAGLALKGRVRENRESTSEEDGEEPIPANGPANSPKAGMPGRVAFASSKNLGKGKSIKNGEMRADAPVPAGIAPGVAVGRGKNPEDKPRMAGSLPPAVNAAQTAGTEVDSSDRGTSGIGKTNASGILAASVQNAAVETALPVVDQPIPADTLSLEHKTGSDAAALVDTTGAHLYDKKKPDASGSSRFYFGLAGLRYSGLTRVGANPEQAAAQYRLVKLGSNWGGMAKAGYCAPLSPAWGLCAEAGLGLLVRQGRCRVQPGNGGAFAYEPMPDSLGFTANPQPTVEQDFRQETGMVGVSLLLRYRLGILSLCAGGRFWAYAPLRQKGPAHAAEGVSLHPVAGVALRLRPRLSLEATGQLLRIKEAALPLPLASQSNGGLYSVGLVWCMK